jgi:tRNA (cytidine/uridine-2'-O-)-methyltransferase
MARRKAPISRPRLDIVLHQPEIPDNTGNVGRTCVAVGAKLWLVRPLGFRLDDRHLRRAGLDYWNHLDYEVVDDWPALLNRLREKGTGPIGAEHPPGGSRKLDQSPSPAIWLFTKHASRPYTDARFAPGDALVFGGESQGLPPSLLEADADRCLCIPMNPEARSLNLAVSVAVAAYEALRQCAGH